MMMTLVLVMTLMRKMRNTSLGEQAKERLQKRAMRTMKKNHQMMIMYQKRLPGDVERKARGKSEEAIVKKKKVVMMMTMMNIHLESPNQKRPPRQEGGSRARRHCPGLPEALHREVGLRRKKMIMMMMRMMMRQYPEGMLMMMQKRNIQQEDHKGQQGRTGEVMVSWA